MGDHVEIAFKNKGPTQGINLYYRLRGESSWTYLARDTNSPYNDHTPLKVANTPETREYQAFGVLNDQQIGLPSDIVSVTFGGGEFASEL
jgi:hypothetical protein